MIGYGVAPRTTNQGEELLASLALGVTSGAVTAMLLSPKNRGPAFRVLLAALLVDAVLMGLFERKYGGV